MEEGESKASCYKTQTGLKFELQSSCSAPIAGGLPSKHFCDGAGLLCLRFKAGVSITDSSGALSQVEQPEIKLAGELEGGSSTASFTVATI